MHFIVNCASILMWRPYYINIECMSFKTSHLLKCWLTKFLHSSRTEAKHPKGHLPYFLRITSMFQCKVPGIQMEQCKGFPASTVVWVSLICNKLGCRLVRFISNLIWEGSMLPFCLRGWTVFTAIEWIRLYKSYLEESKVCQEEAYYEWQRQEHHHNSIHAVTIQDLPH
jgi:hypothetical protein